MNTKNSINMEGQSYETPSVNVLNVLSEGVLCGSGRFTIADWEQEGEDDALNF